MLAMILHYDELAREALEQGAQIDADSASCRCATCIGRLKYVRSR